MLEVKFLPPEVPSTSNCESEECRTLRMPAPGPGLLVAALDGSSALGETECMQKTELIMPIINIHEWLCRKGT